MRHIHKRSQPRISHWVLSALCLHTALTGCSDKKDPALGQAGDAGTGAQTDCTTADCAASATPIAWGGKNPEFFAQLRVVDALGAPLEGATVSIGEHTEKTDAEGRAKVGPVPASQKARVRVEKAGQTPAVTDSSAWKAGQSRQEIGLVPIGEEKAFKQDEPVKISDGGARAELKARSLATADGVRAAEGKAQATYFPPDKTRKEVMPGSQAGITKEGAPTAIDEVLGVMYLHFADMAGNALNLAPGQTAQVTFPVPKDGKAREADTVPLWSLDEESATWKKEGSCVVSKRKVGDDTQLACTGSVSHFSYWALATEIDVAAKGSLGCVNAVTSVDKDACFSASIRRQVLYACNAQGEQCRATDLAREVFVATEGATPNWCGVLEAADTYRMQLVYAVDASGCKDLAAAPLSGLRTKLTAPVSLASFADRVGSELLSAFTADSPGVCESECTQVPFELGMSDLSSPVWVDQDDDAFFQATDGTKDFAPGVPADCDDRDASTHPGAAEAFCVSEDRNCDGKTNAPVKSYTDVDDAEEWNASCGVCMTSGAKATEKPGNLYDEDCDGKADDRDGDGVLEPADCDDYDAATSPKAMEVAGNRADENCDGLALDADNDGVLAIEHIDAAKMLGLDPSTFTDCDDFDPRTNPGVKPGDEAGALRELFYMDAAFVRRRAAYCNLFDGSGAPTPYYHQLVKDLNCDGIVTDVDGDGYTAVGDNSLGADKATDCNDLDPRDAPTGMDRACRKVDGMLNDSQCNVDVPTGDNACPAVTLSGVVLATVCQETVDPLTGAPSGTGVCNYKGWDGGNPLSARPGSLWGPCDGTSAGRPLPDCVEGSSCAGPLRYTDLFASYLEETYLNGDPIAFKGMCFPLCAIP